MIVTFLTHFLLLYILDLQTAVCLPLSSESPNQLIQSSNLTLPLPSDFRSLNASLTTIILKLLHRQKLQDQELFSKQFPYESAKLSFPLEDSIWPIHGTPLKLSLEATPGLPLTEAESSNLLQEAHRNVIVKEQERKFDGLFWYPNSPSKRNPQIARLGIIKDIRSDELTWGDVSRIIMALEEFYFFMNLRLGVSFSIDDSNGASVASGVVKAPKRKSTA
ncbi:hypothetical protein ACLMJK_006616 [Lecanora helva]